MFTSKEGESKCRLCSEQSRAPLTFGWNGNRKRGASPTFACTVGRMLQQTPFLSPQQASRERPVTAPAALGAPTPRPCPRGVSGPSLPYFLPHGPSISPGRSPSWAGRWRREGIESAGGPVGRETEKPREISSRRVRPGTDVQPLSAGSVTARELVVTEVTTAGAATRSAPPAHARPPLPQPR